MSHSAFIIFNIISSWLFYHWTLCPVRCLLHSTVFPVDVFYFLTFSPLLSLLTLFLCPFVIIYNSTFFTIGHFSLFDVFSVDLLSHSTFCPSTFFAVGVFYFDFLSVNPYFCPDSCGPYLHTVAETCKHLILSLNKLVDNVARAGELTIIFKKGLSEQSEVAEKPLFKLL
jgi:hypothetical protein